MPVYRIEPWARLRVSASIGVAVSEDGQEAQELLRRADKAMYRVKLGRSAGSLGR